MSPVRASSLQAERDFRRAPRLRLGTGAGARGPHLPVSHSFALEFAVGVRPQARQLLLASEGPVPLLAAAVVHAVALTGRGAATETATLRETATASDGQRANPGPRRQTRA